MCSWWSKTYRTDVKTNKLLYLVILLNVLLKYFAQISYPKQFSIARAYHRLKKLCSRNKTKQPTKADTRKHKQNRLPRLAQQGASQIQHDSS